MSLQKNISASTLIKTGQGKIRGIFVSSASGSPTIKVTNSLDGASGVMANTFIPVAGTFYDLGSSDGSDFVTGLYVAIGGTVDCMVIFD